MVSIQSSCKITQTTTISFISGLWLQGKKKKKNKVENFSRFYDSSTPVQVYKPPPDPHHEYPILVSTKMTPRHYTGPQCSIENARLLETQIENYSAFFNSNLIFAPII